MVKYSLAKGQIFFDNIFWEPLPVVNELCISKHGFLSVQSLGHHSPPLLPFTQPIFDPHPDPQLERPVPLLL